jgi:hypothetical protein
MHIDPQKQLVMTRPLNQRTAWDYVPYDGTQYRLAAKLGVTVHTELLGNQQISGLKCWGQRTTIFFRLVLSKEISSRLHAPGRFGMQRILELMFASWPTIPTQKPETSKLS